MRKSDDTISRSDAIEQIQIWAVNLINPKMLSREDAIYILESMPSAQPEIKTDGDTISRRAAIDAAVEAADEWDGGYSRSREEIITLKLRMLPSSNKSGHWVMNPSEVAGDGYYICSNCNNDVYDATDFCPNCGSYNGGRQSD